MEFGNIAVIGGVCLLFLVYLLTDLRIYRKNRESLARIAFVDPITGGKNLASFQVAYRKSLTEEGAFPCAVVLLNVVNFKRVNEKIGHAGGNEILAYSYRKMEEKLDARKGEFAARGEMDHFFLCMREHDPQVVQERLDSLIREICAFQDTSFPKCKISFAAGCCIADTPDMELSVIQDHARTALQSRRASDGKNCIFYDEELARRIEREQAIEELFEGSLEHKDFVVYLQPKVGLEHGQLKGAEALVKWQHPQMGLISPTEFVPLLERSEKICELDFYVFREICRFYRHRMQENKPWYPVSVNLSRYHFYEEKPLERFYQTAKEYDLPRYAIEFELTESMFFGGENLARLKNEIRNMHEMGFRCSMDDFGTGYSSLGLLREFDVDVLKLDRSFFLDMSNEKAKHIIRSIVELAGYLKIETVAEGIEEEEQMEFLSSIPCSMVQGYYYSRPLPVDEFERWAGRYETEHMQKD